MYVTEADPKHVVDVPRPDALLGPIAEAAGERLRVRFRQCD